MYLIAEIKKIIKKNFNTLFIDKLGSWLKNKFTRKVIHKSIKLKKLQSLKSKKIFFLNIKIK